MANITVQFPSLRAGTTQFPDFDVIGVNNASPFMKGGAGIRLGAIPAGVAQLGMFTANPVIQPRVSQEGLRYPDLLSVLDRGAPSVAPPPSSAGSGPFVVSGGGYTTIDVFSFVRQ